MLDDNKKNFLENILDQIEKGVLEKDVLLNIDFLKIKKSGNKDVIFIGFLLNSARKNQEP